MPFLWTNKKATILTEVHAGSIKTNSHTHTHTHKKDKEKNTTNISRFGNLGKPEFDTLQTTVNLRKCLQQGWKR